jgi:hypothetical protein
MECGQLRKFWPLQHDRNGADCGFLDIRIAVVREFVASNAGSMLSVAFGFKEVVPGTLTGTLSSEGVQSENQVILVCQVLADPGENKTVGQLIAPHLGEILGFTVFLLQLDHREWAAKGAKVMDVIEESLQQWDDREKKLHAAQAIRTLIQLVGSNDHRSQGFSSNHSFSDLLAKVGEITTSKAIEPFASVEYLLVARYWLYEDESGDNQPKRWKTMESIGDSIFEHSSTSSEKMFCVRFVLEILRDSRFTALRADIIKWLQATNAAILSLLKDELTIV